MYKISIIVPTYNSASTLKRTLDSIVSQTYKNLQILVIDDGSTDDTIPLITQSFIDKIELHTIAHRGIAHARNIGLQHATGDFILFVDSDDTIAPNYVADILALHNQHQKDILVTGYFRPIYDFSVLAYKTQQEREEKQAFDKVSFREIKINRNLFQEKSQIYQLLNFDLFAPIFNKLYQRSIIEQFHIRFDPTIGNFFEDELFNLHYFSHLSSVAIVDDCYYYADINHEPKPEIFGYNPNGLLGITKIIRAYHDFASTSLMQSTDCDLLIKNLLVRKIKMVVRNIIVMPSSTIPQKMQYIEDVLNNPEFMELVQECGMYFSFSHNLSKLVCINVAYKNTYTKNIYFAGLNGFTGNYDHLDGNLSRLILHTKLLDTDMTLFPKWMGAEFAMKSHRFDLAQTMVDFILNDPHNQFEYGKNIALSLPSSVQ